MGAGQFRIKTKYGATSMMEALGIDESRCEELCNAVDEVRAAHPDWNIARVLEQASEVCENQNEALFMMYVFGNHIGFEDGFETAEKLNFVKKAVRSWFEHFQRAHHGRKSFMFSDN
jgi:hypothetical protein